MGVDFKEALTYAFKDNSWKLKFTVLTIVMFIPTLLMVLKDNFIFNIPFAIFIVGFNVLLMNNLIGEKTPVLPSLNIKKIFKEGLKYYGVITLFFIIYIGISVALLVFYFIFIFFISISAKFNLASNASSLNLVMLIVTCLWALAAFGFVSFFLIIVSFSQLLFSENLSFKEAFNIKKCINVFIKNLGVYLFLFLVFLIINVPLGLYYNISYIYDNKAVLILTILLSMPINVFLSFLYANLLVQAYKQSLAKIESDEVKLENLKHAFNGFDYKAIGLMIIISLSVIAVIFSMPISEESSLGRLFTQLSYKTTSSYEFYHHLSCQSNRYKLNKPTLFPVIKGGKFGYIDKTGKIVIEPKYAYADDFYDELALVNVGGISKKPSLYNKDAVGGKYGFIDTKGNFVIKPIFDYAFSFNNEKTTWVRIGDKHKFIDRTGKYVKNIKNKFNSDLSKVKEGRKYGFRDKSGNIVIDPVYDKVYDFSDGIARVEKNKKMGAINTKGQVVIDIKYDYLSDFREGLAIVVLKGKYGYIDKDSEIVIRPQFRDACNFSEGLADANYNHKVGYIDKTGQFVVKPQYDANFSFVNGIAPVRINNKWGYVDKKGNYIWKPTN